MSRRSRALRAIRGEAGASLIFVLAIMLLLMAIGTSAMTAAGVAAGVGVNRRINAQLGLYADSLHKSVMYSIQTSGSDVGRDVLAAVGGPETLGGQILAIIYAHTLSSPEEVDDSVLHYEHSVRVSNINLTPRLVGDENKLSEIYTSGIDVSIEPHVRVTKAHSEEFLAPGVGGTVYQTRTLPREASISAQVKVTVLVEYGGRSLTSVVTYACWGGFLSDEGAPGQMIIKNAGDWGFVSHERIDS